MIGAARGLLTTCILRPWTGPRHGQDVEAAFRGCGPTGPNSDSDAGMEEWNDGGTRGRVPPASDTLYMREDRSRMAETRMRLGSRVPCRRPRPLKVPHFWLEH